MTDATHPPELVAAAEQLRAVYDSGTPIPPIRDSIASAEEAVRRPGHQHRALGSGPAAASSAARSG